MTTWAWDFGDGNTSTAQNPSHTYLAPGIYTVTLTVTNGAGSDTHTALDLITAGAAGDTEAPVVVAFGNDPLDANPQWQSIAPYVQGWSVEHRGRVYELDENETGTGSVDLVDPDGDLDPSNPDSPFAGQILPLKPVQFRLTNPMTGETSVIFTSYAEEWDYSIDLAEVLLTGKLATSDGFELLAAQEVIPDASGQATYAQQAVDDALHARLTDAGWPSSWRNIFSGNVQVQQVAYQGGTDILSTLKALANAEFPGVGNLFMTRDGLVAFRGRKARFNYADYVPANRRRTPSKPTLTWNVGDERAIQDAGDDSWARIADIEWCVDKKNIINAALISPEHIAMKDVAGQLVVDTGSSGQFGPRPYKVDGLLVALGTTTGFSAKDECKLYGLYYVQNYAQPRQRITKLVFQSVDPADPSNAGTWELLCGIELDDLLFVTTHNPGNGGFANEGFFVEGIRYEVALGNDRFPKVTVTLDLSPQAWFTTFPSSLS